MKSQLLNFLIIAMVVLSLLSCATIVAGGSPKVIIQGDTDEPVTIVTEKGIYENVDLPCQVRVSRHNIEGQRITVQSEHHKYRPVLLEKTINEWTFGNILLGGVIGWSVDLITNCVSRPLYTRYNVVEMKTRENDDE